MVLRLVFIIGSLVTTGVILFGGLAFIQPEWLFSKLRQRSPEVLYSVETQKKVVALTIDDGPDPFTSPELLDILKKYKAQATFFLITERIPGNEPLIQRMVDEGHELGNHLTSDDPSIQYSTQEFKQQLVQADEVLSRFGEIRWFRPGSGWYNDKMLSVIHENGYRCALGSVYPYDPQIGSAWFSTKYVLWKVKPGAIIILHDYQRRGERAAAALSKILPELARRGYQVVTLSELVERQNLDH